MKVGVFTVMLPDLTPEEAVMEIRAAGYDGVEWRVTHFSEKVKNDAPSFWGNNLCTFAPTKAEAKRARAISERAGLETPNLGTYIGLDDIEGAKAAVDFAKILGSPHFRVGFGNFEGDYAKHFADARVFLGNVIAIAKEAQLKPLIEIHHGTIVPSASLMYRLVSHFSSDEVGVIHDAGNMAQEGFEDYRLGLELLGDYLSEVHVKNAAFKAQTGVWQGRWAPLRSGVVDFGSLFTALKAAEFDGWLVLEDFSQALPSREALTDNLAFVRDVWEAA